MMMINFTVYSSCPEAIKKVSVITVFKNSSKFETQVCGKTHTNELFGLVLSHFEIKPYYKIDFMRSNQNLFSLTSKFIKSIKLTLTDIKSFLFMFKGFTKIICHLMFLSMELKSVSFESQSTNIQ